MEVTQSIKIDFEHKASALGIKSSKPTTILISNSEIQISRHCRQRLRREGENLKTGRSVDILKGNGCWSVKIQNICAIQNKVTVRGLKVDNNIINNINALFLYLDMLMYE